MISTKGRYALRVMLDLAEHGNEGYIPLKDIAKRQAISDKYLESILKSLVKQKMLKGLRGKGGGYQLTRTPAEYSVGEILEVAEGTLAPVACLMDDAEDCPRANQCRTLPMWKFFVFFVFVLIHCITISFRILLWNRYKKKQSFYQKNKFLYRWRQIFAMMIGYMNRILEREIGEGNLG